MGRWTTRFEFWLIQRLDRNIREPHLQALLERGMSPNATPLARYSWFANLAVTWLLVSHDSVSLEQYWL